MRVWRHYLGSVAPPFEHTKRTYLGVVILAAIDDRQRRLALVLALALALALLALAPTLANTRTLALALALALPHTLALALGDLVEKVCHGRD